MAQLSADQQRLLAFPPNGRIFLEGPAGSGKTTAAIARLNALLSSGVPGQSILILVPQLTLGTRYREALRDSDSRAGGEPAILTFSGLARRNVELYWPIVAEASGFENPDQAPTFLTLELAQYYMSEVVAPYLERGYFENITIERNRLFSEILDNLNKAALVGFPHREIAKRLKDAWVGDQSVAKNFDQAQECANEFRELCLRRSLLDFSLQVEVFRNHAWQLPICRESIVRQFSHLIVDNLEEDTPALHDTLREWLPSSQTALLVFDRGAGYRRFLGADPDSALALKDLCEEQVVFERSLVSDPGVQMIERSLANRVSGSLSAGARASMDYASRRFYPEMIGWVAEKVHDLVDQHDAPPHEIAVLAPYLSNSLRFALTTRLEKMELETYSQRPSRALREEPATAILLTLARLSHPEWGGTPSKEEVRQALVGSIRGLDLVRGRLISEILYRPDKGLHSFEGLAKAAQERITYSLGLRYEQLRQYLNQAAAREDTLDSYLGALFGELLSQPGFGFHNDFEAGAISANLIDSVRQFRLAVEEDLSSRGISVNQAYIELVREGLIAAQYVRSWELQPEGAVFLSPAYTFLLANRPVDYQIWVNVGSSGWWERPYQPLTHPYVLSRQWSKGRRWQDQDELRTRAQIMQVLTQGLLRRCRRAVFFGLSELNEHGTEEQGPLLDALQRTVLAQR